ncbi:MAG: hypothetical protein HDR32_06300 [Treponema sp.]|nr:hypothetical protein [Treponema sp.]
MEVAIQEFDEAYILRKCHSDLYENIDFFLGAGASIESGIPSGHDIVWMLKRELYCSEERKDSSLYENLQSQSIRDELQKYFDSKGDYPAKNSDNEYSFYFEKCFPKIEERDAFIRNLIKDKKPSFGYKNLGRVLVSNFSKTVWTTNFDNLISVGLKDIGEIDIREYSNDRPPEISKLRDEEYPTICHLHGDIKYDHTKNTATELDNLDSSMEECFKHVLTKKALFVIGYSGIDNSIMSFFEKNINDSDFLSKGLYWFNVKNGWISDRVKRLLLKLQEGGKPCGIVNIKSFDSFMQELISHLGLQDVDNSDLDKAALNIKIGDKNFPVRNTRPVVYKKDVRKINIDIEYIYEKFLCTELNEVIGCGILEFQKYFLNMLDNFKWDDFPNIVLKGMAGIGKTTEMKLLYNKMVDNYSDKFFPVFLELQNYTLNMFNLTFSSDFNYLVFIDGFEEFKDSLFIQLLKDIKNILLLHKNVRVVVSGRSSSFIEKFEIGVKSKTLVLKPYKDTNQKDIRNLVYKFDNTLIKNFIEIPVFRDMAESGKIDIRKSYFEQYNYLLNTIISIDEKRFRYTLNISERMDNEKDGNLLVITESLKKLSQKLLGSNKLSFSEKDLYDCCNSYNEYEFLLKSSLFNYIDKESIEFASKYYFYYFLSFYISEFSKEKIEKLFFTRTGKIKEKYIDLFYNVLKIIQPNSVLYKLIKYKLAFKSPTYILLTDYTYLSCNNRFEFYKKIINEYNRDEKLIYYGRFRQTHDLLKNIDSLSDSMHKLLPEEFYDDAIRMHYDVIFHFIENPSFDEITEFENAVILLGVHDKIWKENQQVLLKKVSIPLIKFFRENKLAREMKGLLSEDIIFSWYEDYGWTNDWGENEWESFVKEITGIETVDFYHFSLETEFRLKLKLFIHFHKNEYIRKLLVPLVMKTLESKNDDIDAASFVPSSLDDEFKTPTIHFDNDISYFTYAIKNYEIQVSDLLLILTSCIGNYIHHSLSYQLEELYKEIINLFKNSIHNISDNEMPKLYELFKKYIDTDSGMYITDFRVYINLLDDNQKEKLFVLLLDDLKQKEGWQKLWMLHSPIILLLDISDENESRSLFEELKEIDSVYRECIADIYIAKRNKHPLYDIAVAEYPRLFPEQVEKEKRRAECVSRFETEKEAMLNKEIDIISSKEDLLDEMQRVFEYLDKGENVPQKDTDRGKLIELQADYIGNKIQYTCSEECFAPPVFSSFTIKYLFNCTDDDKKLNREQAIKNIEDWFSDEKYFWRYFFWLFICHYKKEETDTFLEKYAELAERIKSSMEKEVSYFLANDGIEAYDGGGNRYWVVPFVHYIGRFYSNILPDWIDKKKILNFIAYPAWKLSTGFGVHVNGEFKWEKWNSVFDWIEEVSEIDRGSIIKYALYLLPQLTSDQSQSQIITIFVEKVKSESAYKQQMLDAIIEKTIVEIQKDYKDINGTFIMNGGALSSFWRETEENLIDRIYPYIDFSKYNVDDVNYCRKSVLEYFCKVATEKQKINAIKTLNKKIDDENIRIYLAKLGYDKAIIKTINKFLAGENLNTNLSFYTPLFGKTKKTFHLVLKYCQLYKYSFEKNSDRRQYLTEYAISGIMQTVSRRNFWLVKRFLNNLIEERKRKGLYYEGIYDFLNEIEQTVFGNDTI